MDFANSIHNTKDLGSYNKYKKRLHSENKENFVVHNDDDMKFEIINIVFQKWEGNTRSIYIYINVIEYFIL